MLNQDQRQQIKRFIDILLRRKKLIIFCLLIAVAIGLGKYIKSPKVYRSSSLIMYQQKINPTELSPDLSKFQEIVSTVTQQITSRTSLESLITQFDLYRDLRASLPMEDVVEIMRNNHISIRPDTRGNTFEVAYQGSVPRTVLLVTNALAAKFIEENIKVREETVSEVSAYIKDELSMAKDALNKKEAAMRDYKLKYYNEMPDQREPNISRLNALQIQYQNYQNNLQELARTKVLLQEQISMRKDMLSQMAQGGNPVLSGAAQIAQLQSNLDMLLTRYTEKHPDVRRLKSQIARLQEEMATEAKTENTGNKKKSDFIDPQLYEMQKQVENIDYNVVMLTQEKEKTLEHIKQYMLWIEAAPVREAEWTDLTRDYQQFHNHYEKLVGQNIQADSAQSLERRQKGSQFKIIDPAHFPEKPFSPDFVTIMLMALGIGLGAGAALALGLELLDTSFRDAHDLEKFLDLPVACSIPVIRTDREIRIQFLKSAAWVTMLVLSLTILGGGIALLVYKGIVII